MEWWKINLTINNEVLGKAKSKRYLSRRYPFSSTLHLLKYWLQYLWYFEKSNMNTNWKALQYCIKLKQLFVDDLELYGKKRNRTKLLNKHSTHIFTQLFTQDRVLESSTDTGKKLKHLPRRVWERKTPLENGERLGNYREETARQI